MISSRTMALFAASTALTTISTMPGAAQTASPAQTMQSAPVPQSASVSSNVEASSPVQAAPIAPPTTSAPTATDDGGRVQDIIVTAQRRGQNLQQVPIAVTAATAETLGNLGIRSTSDIGTIAPAVTFAVGLGGAAVTIRGIGGTGAGTDEAANALYIDGVYIPAPQAAVFEFNNIDRVEILKGPQGTLFGRNASGGLIQVITPDPSQDLKANVEVGYGNYKTVQGAATVSGGLTDSLAVSLSGVYNSQGEGWGRNVTLATDAYRGRSYAGRLKAVWQMGPDTKLTATALYAFNKTAGIQGAQILAGERLFGGGGALGFYDQEQNTPGYNRSKDTNYALTISHRFDWASITSITSRDIAESRLIVDADLSPSNRSIADIKGPKTSWTQELQLASPTTSRIQWLVGLFYFHNDLYQSPFRVAGSALAPLTYRDTNPHQETNSYAAYGQATAPVTGTTNLTVGLRYTIDKRRFDVSTTTSSGVTTVFPTQSTEDKKLTWRFAVDQKFAERVLGYASYSRGFKSGLYNVTNPGSPPVRPQTIDAYEVGLKSDLFDRRVRLNLSAFHYDVKDVQLRTIVPGNPTPIFYNAAKERTNGAEAELNVSVTRQFSLQGNVSFLSAKYSSFPGAVYYRVNPAPGFGLTLLPPSDASGNTAVYSPRWVTNLSVQYKLPTSIGAFTLAGTWNYNDGYYFDPQDRVANPSYHLLNGTLTWQPTEAAFVRAYVKNIAGEKYYTTIQPSNFGDYYFPAAPRTYGVTLGAKF